MAPAFAILASNDAAAKVAGKNSAAAGVQLFQPRVGVTVPTYRSEDVLFYVGLVGPEPVSRLLGQQCQPEPGPQVAPSNAPRNCLINFRRTNGVNGQSHPAVRECSDTGPRQHVGRDRWNGLGRWGHRSSREAWRHKSRRENRWHLEVFLG